jgi:tetratricopeptide (TPR) repeat protein
VEAPVAQDDSVPMAEADADSELFRRAADLLLRQASASGDPAASELEAVRRELEAYYREHLDSVPALRLLAEMAQRRGDREEAHLFIGRAEALDPWNLEILIISESIHEPGGAMSGSGGEPQAVDPEKILERAMGFFRLGELERAYSLTRLAYLLAPSQGFFLLDVWAVGAAYDPKRALQDLVRLHEQVGDMPYLLLAIGSVCNVMGLYPEAVAWLERGLRPTEDPFVAAMLLNELAYVQVKMGQHLERCIQMARHALEIFPNAEANGFIRDTLGVAYLKKGDLDKAVANLREAVAKDPTSIPRFHLALALLARQDAAGALGELRLIASARPSLESPHLEEMAILERVQKVMPKLDELLNLGGGENLAAARELLEDLI